MNYSVDTCYSDYHFDWGQEIYYRDVELYILCNGETKLIEQKIIVWFTANYDLNDYGIDYRSAELKKNEIKFAEGMTEEEKEYAITQLNDNTDLKDLYSLLEDGLSEDEVYNVIEDMRMAEDNKEDNEYFDIIKHEI